MEVFICLSTALNAGTQIVTPIKNSLNIIDVWDGIIDKEIHVKTYRTGSNTTIDEVLEEFKTE